MRPSKRQTNELRPITIKPNVSSYAEGSCMIKYGNTQLLCTASIEERVPRFLKGQGVGWITAEYNMLPRATHTRSTREVVNGKPSGRTMEIQRLIGRSLRAIANMRLLGERQIIIDCDVLQADGGTRTAAITGGYVSLHLACAYLLRNQIIRKFPLIEPIAAISCGIFNGTPILDLEYIEDSQASTDANFVFTGSGKIIEIQATAEEAPFNEAEFTEMLSLAKSSIGDIVEKQKRAIGDN